MEAGLPLPSHKQGPAPGRKATWLFVKKCPAENVKLVNAEDSNRFQFNNVVFSFALVTNHPKSQCLLLHLFLIHGTIDVYRPAASALFHVSCRSGAQADEEPLSGKYVHSRRKSV